MIIDQHISRPIGDDLIVTSRGAHRMFLLNPPAKFIWECMCDEIATSLIPQKMVDHFGIGLEIAKRDLDTTLTEWRRAGLVPPEAPHQCYMVADVSLTIYFSSANADECIRPLFEHLEIDDVACCEVNAHVDFEIRDTPNGYEIASDGTSMGTFKSMDQLLESMTAKLVDVVHDRSENAFSLHAAVIGYGDRCILMPGRSGSGKSTLTAALVAAGYSYYTDDTALLDEEFRAIPLPSPLVLKGKKWPSLEPILPDIAHLPIYTRGGADVRYWSPPRSEIARENLPVGAIIFPTYRRDEAFRVTELSPAQTLERIVGASCMIRAPIDDVILDQLIGWLEQIPSYAMTYGGLSDPMTFIAEKLKQ